MNSDKVSIIIPVYNVEQYLTKCLESAIYQNYKNKEIIVINDGSTDGSLAILEEFKLKYPELIIKNIKNQGQSVARNTGLEIATGSYILFLDSDDWIENNTISICMENVKSHKKDIVFFAASAFCDGLDERMAKNFNYERLPELQNKTFSAHRFFTLALNLDNYIVSPCLYIYNKKKLESVKFLPGIIHEDNLFTTRLLLEDESVSVNCIADRLYHRRVRPDSTMTQIKQEKHINGYLSVAKELLNLHMIKKNNSTGKSLNKFAQGMILSALATCQSVHHNKFPIAVRLKAIKLLMKVNPRFIKLKSLAYCLIPELMVLNKTIKQQQKYL